MKKTAIAVAVFVMAVLMVLPVMRSVNLSAGKPVTIDGTLSADGWPLPAFPPKAPSMDASTLMAVGWPLPWPHLQAETLVADGPGTLVADGWPLPWPHLQAETLVADGPGTLVADGWPLPWPKSNSFAA